MNFLMKIAYQNRSSIVKIHSQNKQASTAEIYRDVKQHFNISGDIQFKEPPDTPIADDILDDYVNQYRISPGWFLVAVDVDSAQITGNRVIDLELDEIYSDSDIRIEAPSYTVETLESTKTLSSLNAQIFTDTEVQIAQSNCNVETLEGIKSQSSLNDVQHFLTNEDFAVKVSSVINTEVLTNLEDLDYKIIIREHTTKRLENSERTKLAKIVIRHILESNVNTELNRYDYMFLADIISQVLPQEPKEIYYSSAKFGETASGKVYDAYNNYRKKLSQSGFLKRRAYITKTIGRDIREEESNEITYLKANSTFNENLIHKWEKCLTERQQMLQNSDLTTYQFLEQFPIFNTNDNCIFELLKRDVVSLYPSYSSIQSWDGFYNNVFQKLTSIKDSTAQKILKSAQNINEDSKKAVAFLLLPYMFPSTVLRIQKREYTKASKIEVQEKFISHYQTLQEADNFDRLSIDFQPKLVFVGDLDKLCAYVILCGKKYFLT